MRPHLPDAVARRLDPAERYGLRTTLLAFALVVVAVPFGLLVSQVRATGGWSTSTPPASNGCMNGPDLRPVRSRR